MSSAEIALFVSGGALLVSICSLLINFIVSRRSHADALFKLRLDALVKSQAVEIKWQDVLNELYHHKRKVEMEMLDPVRKAFVINAIDEWHETFVSSRDHAKSIRKGIEEELETMPAKMARKCLAYAELAEKSLAASHAEMAKKLRLLTQ